MKYKHFLMLVLATVVGLVLAACGSDNSNNNESSGSSGDEVTVEYWGLDSQKSLYEPIIKDFEEENPDIKIDFSTRSVDSHKEALKVAASSGTLPDVWFNWGGTLGSFYPENGLTLDLSTYAEENDWESKYLDAGLELAKYEDQLTGVPTKLASLGLMYRKDIFDDLGIEPPTTFDELEDVMATLKDNGITPVALGGKHGWQTMRFTEAILEHYAGPDLKDSLMELDESWENEAVVQTYEKLKEWNEKDYFPKGFITNDPDESKIPFYNGDSAMILDGPWFDTTALEDDFDVDKIGVFSFPTDQNPQRVSSFVETLQINADASEEVQDAAVKFAEYSTSLEAIEKNPDNFHWIVPAEDAKVPESLPNVEHLVDALDEGAFVITDQALPQELVVKFFEAQDNVILGEFTPEDAAEFLQDAAESLK